MPGEKSLAFNQKNVLNTLLFMLVVEVNSYVVEVRSEKRRNFNCLKIFQKYSLILNIFMFCHLTTTSIFD